VRHLPALLTLLATLGALAPARAQEDPRTAAKRHYEQGVALTNAADYNGALEQFRQAYSKSPNFAVLYNIGQAEAVLGHLLEAIAALSRYLKDGGAEIPEGRREEVKTQIAALEARLAEVTITTQHSGALVRVDGRDLGRTPLYEPIRLAPGRHLIILSDGARTLSTTVEIREAERRTLSLTLPDTVQPPVSAKPPAASPAERPAAVRVARSSVPPVREPAPVPASSQRAVFAYGLAGAGVALGGGAFAHYLWNRGRYSDWKTEHAKLQADRFASDYRERQLANNELATSIRRGTRVSVTLALAAGALATTGGVLLLTNGGDEKRGVSLGWTDGRTATAHAWTTW
jgi:hypothetical protein